MHPCSINRSLYEHSGHPARTLHYLLLFFFGWTPINRSTPHYVFQKIKSDGHLKALRTIFLVFFVSCGQNEEGNNQDSLRIAAVVCMHLFTVMLLLTLLLFSLGWGFIRPSLRFKEGWLVSNERALVFFRRAAGWRRSLPLFSCLKYLRESHP